MNLVDAIKWGINALQQAGIKTARNDAEILSAHAIGVSRNELKKRLILNEIMPDETFNSFELLIKQRADRVPLQRLTGKAPFRYIELNVGSGVFIPRPETELVAGAGIDWLHNQIRHRALVNDQTPMIAIDLGTGSGAIAIAIATECPEVKVYTVELDETAHNWAAQNIKKLAPNTTLINDDARTALTELNGQVDLVISNPPYLAPDEVPADPEVNNYDPEIALFGKGGQGLEIPQGIAKAAARLLKPGGFFVMEHGDAQAPAVISRLAKLPFENITSHQDLTNRDRFVTAVRSQ